MLARALSRHIHYGWVIVAASFCLTMTYSVFASFGVFLKPLTSEFRWSSTEISAAFSVAVLVISVSMILFGKLLDRYGAKVSVALGGTLMIAGLVLASQADSLLELYLFFGLIAPAGVGASYIPSIATVTKWFERRKGLALGIATNGYSIGMLTTPLILQYFITRFNWRTAFLLSAIIILVLVCIGAFLLEGSPEKLGLRPYGFSGADDRENNRVNLKPEMDVAAFKFSEVSRTLSFTLLLGIFIFQNAVYTMVLVHLVAFAVDAGILATLAAGTLGFLGVGGIIGKLTAGHLADKVGRVKTLVVFTSAQGVAMATLISQPSLLVFYVSAFFYGFASDGSWVQLPPICQEFYGPVSVGVTFGVIEGVGTALGGSFGAAFAGIIRDLAGSYLWVFGVASGLSSFAAALGLKLKPPKAVFSSSS